jgi:hypothetical protein
MRKFASKKNKKLVKHFKKVRKRQLPKDLTKLLSKNKILGCENLSGKKIWIFEL